MKHHFPMMATLILVVFGNVSCTELEPYRDNKNGQAISLNGNKQTNRVMGKQYRGRGLPPEGTIQSVRNDAASDYMDQQQFEMERAFSQELKSHVLDLQRHERDVIQLSLPSQAFFNVFSSEIQTDFRVTLAKASLIIRKFDKTAVHIIGHTDNTGTPNYNQLLSERRAITIAGFLNNHGVEDVRLRIEGQGEFSPLLSNESAEGRRKNRRVDIFLKPIVEGKVEWAFTSPQ